MNTGGIAVITVGKDRSPFAVEEASRLELLEVIDAVIVKNRS